MEGESKKAKGKSGAAYSRSTFAFLLSPCLVGHAVLLVERAAEALEVGVEGDEARALKEGPPARLVGEAVKRALAEAHGAAAVARQAHRRGVERVDRHLALFG